MLLTQHKTLRKEKQSMGVKHNYINDVSEAL